MIGKCKELGVVYEIECITCKKKNENYRTEILDIEDHGETESKESEEKTGEKRK